MDKQKLRYIELFCGLGGFQYVFPEFTCVYAYDHSSRSKKLYETNFNTMVHTKLNIPLIPKFDILCSSPRDIETQLPILGQVIDHHNPGYVLVDLPKKTSKEVDELIHQCKKRGYHVYTHVLNASRFGLAQFRERTYFLAIRADINNTGFQWADVEDMCSNQVVTVKEILDQDVSMDMTEALVDKYDLVEHNGRMLKHRPSQKWNLIRKNNGKGGRQGERVYAIDHPGCTICYCSGSPGSYTGLYDVDGKIRTLTVVEALRMFGFPDTYRFQHVSLDVRVLRMLGNSICVPVMKAIVKRVFL